MASFASLGDIILAEPGAMVGFAGQRVIKETTHQNLPKGFQTAEFLEEHGLIDLIVHRKRLRPQISQFLSYFTTVQ
jgi:acetyl-CoA carboxylase carboxyl transferase subunit beta